MSKVYVFTEYGGPQHEQLIDREPPQPGPGQIAVQVRAAGVNPVDWKIREGLLGRSAELPAPMGREAAGVVTAVGEGVSDFSAGDEVLGHPAPGLGAFAEHTLFEAETAHLKPEEVSFTDAATIPVAGTTAYDTTHVGDLDAGATVLILGAGGGVGYMATQICAVHQFRVLAVASEAKRELLEAKGATFIASDSAVAEAVAELAPDGVDLIVDLVGGDTLRSVAPAAVSADRVVSAADPATAEELGGQGRPTDPETLEKITDVISYELVDPHVTAQYPLSQAREALAAVESGHTEGKIVVVP